jgi:FKBP-type peptidyl-prolyl cis-trans isomerase
LETVIEAIRKHSKGKREVEGNPRIRLAKIAESENEKQAALALERAESYLHGAAASGGVCVLKPGKLLYRILTSGTGVGIREMENPLLHLVEKDLDGEILHDTYKASCPVRLSLDEAVLGLKLGVMGMKVGERREIIVHPDLAYKKLGKTKPNQLMIYDVTLIEN